MDVEQLDKACRDYPVVRELMKDNMHLSVAALAREMRDKLLLFDGNHTRAQAALVDRLKQLEDRLQSSAIFARDLQKRITALEVEPSKEPAS